jgi:pyrroline-5-carboxylate reductase
MQIAFIGGGVMAEAMLRRAIDAGIVAAPDVYVAEPIKERRKQVEGAHGVKATASNAEAVRGAAMVVLAVKPQVFDAVAADLHGQLDGNQTVLSIMAGVPMRKIVDSLGHPNVIRVMPNTPAQIGAGMSVWTATKSVAPDARNAAAALLGVLGREWAVSDESFLDMATAVSGSGPAYVFAFIEALIAAGASLGMPDDMAYTLAVETVAGAARLAKDAGEDPGLLRERVTSPGGTTAAGLQAMTAGEFQKTIQAAVDAGHRRAKELGGGA